MSKIVLITGASRGIGASTAYLAAKKGYSVCINYLNNHDAAQELVKKIESENGKAFAIQADISDENQVIELFNTIDKNVGRISSLVNNAAILEKQMPLAEMSVSRLNKVFSTNITGSFLCCREAIKRMSIKHGGNGGAIVNLSSIASKLGSPFEYIDYAASKGAIDTLTIGLSKELVNENIRVNAVRPGMIYTDIHASGGEPDRVNRLKDSIPMKRGGYPEEVANAVLWLLSDEASYITGSIIDVSGGR